MLTGNLLSFEAAWADAPQVQVFQHCSYQGYSARLAPGAYTTDELLALGISDNDLSSMTIPVGYSATLYRGDDFSGVSHTYKGSSSCFVADGWNDRASSIEVKVGATVYQDCWYSGYEVHLPVGEYTLADLNRLGVRNNDLSSIKVAAGYTVTLYNGDNFGGSNISFSGGKICLVYDGWNDKTTSLVVGLPKNELPDPNEKPNDDIPDPTVSSLVGKMEGHLEVSDRGAAVYKVPLWVPEGRRDMQPELGFVYNSQQRGTGIMGVGWSFTGISEINRCGSTLAQDEAISPVLFSDEDNFCLDGQRLVAIKGLPGEDATEYRTERDSFAKIKSFGSPIRSFVVWTKDHLVYTYGDSEGSDHGLRWAQDDVVASWLHTKTEDRYGNLIKYRYNTQRDWLEAHNAWPEQSAGGGASYGPVLLAIDYTWKRDSTGNHIGGTNRHSIQFGWEQRPEREARNRYIANTRFSSPWRLRQMRVYVENQLARRYVVNYEQSISSERSLVSSIRECDGNDDCLRPLRFDYENGINEFGKLIDAGIAGAKRSPTPLVVLDLNGDGYDDLVTQGEGSSEWRLRVALNTGDPDDPYSGVVDTSFNSDLHLLGSMDYNHDGAEDVVFVEDTDSSQVKPIKVMLGTMGSIVEAGVWTNLESVDLHADNTTMAKKRRNIHLADMDGDGDKDLLICRRRSDSTNYRENRWFLYRFEAAGFSTRQLVSLGHGLEDTDCNVHNILLMDYDGDGATDLLAQNKTRDHFSAFSIATGRTLEDTGLPASKIASLDCSGVSFSKTECNSFPLADNEAEERCLNAGGCFACHDNILEGEELRAARPFDVNGDGLMDIVSLPKHSGDLLSDSLWLNTGNGFVPMTAMLWIEANDTESVEFTCRNQLTALDWDGDGRHELIASGDIYEDGELDRRTWFLLKARQVNDTFFWAIFDKVELPEWGEPICDEDDVERQETARVMDFTGTGSPDVLFEKRALAGEPGQFYFSPHKRRGFDRLVGVDDGMCRAPDGHPCDRSDWPVVIEHSPLSPDIYDARIPNDLEVDTPACADNVDCSRPAFYVVAAHEVDLSESGGRVRYEHKYFDYRSDKHGRGSLGFGAKQIINKATGRVTTKQLDNFTRLDMAAGYAYPYVGRLLKKRSTIPIESGKDLLRVTVVNSSYQSRLVHEDRVFQSFPSVKNEEVYEGEEQLVSTRTDLSWDEYGNPLNVDMDHNSGVLVCNTDFYYRSVDEPKWLVNLVVRKIKTCTRNGKTQQQMVEKGYNYVTGALTSITLDPLERRSY